MMLTQRYSVSTLALCLALGSTMGCERKSDAPNDAGADASPVVTAVVPSAAPTVQPVQPRLLDPDDTSIPAAEPLRKVAQNLDDEPALFRQRDAILGFFKEDVPSPITAQFETLPRNRLAILIPGKSDLERPFVMVIDANGTRAWTKEMPLAGIVSGVRDMAIVRGTEAAVGIAFCDSTGQHAALRMWHNDGSINADFEVIEVPHCDRISAVYIPGAGHIVASSGETTARIGNIAENGMRAWDSAGITLPWTAMPRTALTIAVDSENSFIVIGVGATEEKRRPNDGAIMAMRYDLQGREIWPSRVTLGKRSGRSMERYAARIVEPRKIEVDIGDKPIQRVALSSEGTVIPLK